MTAPHDIIQASWDADKAWHAAIVRTYGERGACYARYDERSTATDELAELYLARAVASDAERMLWQASKEGTYEGAPLAPLHNAHVAAFQVWQRNGIMMQVAA